MKTFLLSTLVVITATAPTSAMVVTAPKDGAHVTSPFNLVASAKSCDAKPVVSMGYSIDSGPTTIASTTLNVMVSASAGNHVVHVKCWGVQANEDVLLDITVIPGSTKLPPAAAAPAFLPAGGKYASAQLVTLSAQTSGAKIYYTTDGTTPTASSTEYFDAIPISKSATIVAIAVAPGYTNSGLATANYVITTSPSIPANAVGVNKIQTMPNWLFHHDPGTTGSSAGSMTLVASPSLSGESAKFASSFLDWGGEIYSRSYATDANATNFLYDAEVWIEAGSVIGNLEMDNNQVIPNGNTVIYAFQCAGDSNTWDYSTNAGTPSAPVVKWLHSSQACNPAEWAPNVWHHVQISYSRDAAGKVTYHSVWLDGVEAPINETVPSAFSLGWAAGDLMTNFQVDGVGAGGNSTLYVDDMTIYRW
jgi:chitobiase/beta-hexosaminidase-like protein